MQDKDNDPRGVLEVEQLPATSARRSLATVSGGRWRRRILGPTGLRSWERGVATSALSFGGKVNIILLLLLLVALIVASLVFLAHVGFGSIWHHEKRSRLEVRPCRLNR